MNVLVLNAGSSSIKYQLIRTDTGTQALAGIVEEVEDHHAALDDVVDGLSGHRVDAVGHRVVHGGESFSGPVVIDHHVLEALRAVSALAPLHNPANLAGVEAAQRVWPDAVHVAVFDTAFHATMSPAAYRYAVPSAWYHDLGVRRYGFHGTSHAAVAARAATLLERPIEHLRLITAHLGNGASTAAIAGGRSVDTSMGLSPLEGLVMGTRSGDVDPAVIPHVATATGRSTADIIGDLNRSSGLLGLCGDSDMRAVIERSATDADAALAVDVFCHRVVRYVGAHLATLGGCDALVFTGGIGERAPTIRARVCRSLRELGFRLDRDRNLAGETIVSEPDSPVAVLVVATDEEQAIAAHTAELARATA